MSRVLVTGGAGFIGSHLCEALVERGDEVYVIDDLSTGRLENVAQLDGHRAFHFTSGTILNYPLLESLVRKVDRIFHLAAVVGVQKIIEVPIDTIEINVLGAHNVLTLAARHNKPCLLASSSEVYGKSNKHPFTEDDDAVYGPTTKSRWGYACSKAIDEFLALAYFRSKKLPITIARLFNTTGPRQTGRYGMVLPRFVEQALRGEPITVFGSGQQSRCFADVSDVVTALILLTDIPEAAGQVFNIGNPEEITIGELAGLVKEMTESASPIRLIPYDEAYQPGFEDMQRRVPNIEKLHRLTGFSPKIKLAQIAHRVITGKLQEMETDVPVMPGPSMGVRFGVRQ
ncbi:MAG: nucleoside-diphosphate sugar epimerase [Acidobacteria bacterium]|jgi:UDP-glucose 4-epimerase|nr:MAG: nucleoside-diphosphate sugar epimerase [Acidobacteriota bacterium]PYV89002.1 MAG: nucleoside-diphosphate sugar epimerase [Acidobacteriota bacterium]